MEYEKFPAFNNYQYRYTPAQLQDINIMLNLNTREEMRDWIEAVGADDVFYGLALLESVALDMLNDATADITAFPEASAAIDRIRNRGD